MSFEAMHKVRASGLTDRTQVDVLEALAFFLNQETGACFPSTESIARISRVNDRLVRTTLKALHDLGYVSSTQMPGQRRYFTLHLDKLPTAEPLKENTSLQDSTPPNKNTPLYKTTPLHESTEEGCRKVQETPVEKCSTPMYETTPEQVINKEIEQVKITRNVVPASDDLFTNDVQMIEKPKKSRAKPKTQCPFSPDEQIPADYLAYAKEKHPSIDALKEFRKFVNSAYANGRKYSDWKAAWRTWTANAEDWKPKTTYTQRNAPLRFDDAYYGDGSF